ncbi:MAG: DHH family phosphoesterase [Candidatus Heimdallarchaeota archaeon]
MRDKLIEKLTKGSYSSIAIVGHMSVDPDAVSSAYGVEFILQSFHPESEIDILIDGISKTATTMLEYYSKPYLTTSEKKYDLIVIVDVNVPNQLGVFKDLILSHDKEKLVIIDHHTKTDFSEKDVSIAYVEEERTSATEMVSEIIFDLDLKPDKKLLNTLLSGIVFDSRRFFSLTPNLLSLIDKMFKLGVDYDFAVKLNQRDYDLSTKVARIKCASRLHLHKIEDKLIVWSSIGSHEGSSARAILDLGADVALVYSRRKRETRLNVRARNVFHKSTGIHFGRDIMKVISEKFDGDGGGHSTAAALNIPSEIEESEIRKVTLSLLEKLIKAKSNLKQ